MNSVRVHDGYIYTQTTRKLQLASKRFFTFSLGLLVALEAGSSHLPAGALPV